IHFKKVNALWYGVIPVQIIGFILVLLFAVSLGFREQVIIERKINAGEVTNTQDEHKHKLVDIYERHQDIKYTIRGVAVTKRWINWINVILTLAIIVVMLANIAPPEFAFMIGVAIALIINFPNVDEQMSRLKAHAPNALMMAAVIIAAGM